MTVDSPVVRLLPETEPLHDGVSAIALAEVTALRDRILRGEITEFVWAGVTPDDNIMISWIDIENELLILAATARLLHVLQLGLDKSLVLA